VFLHAKNTSANDECIIMHQDEKKEKKKTTDLQQKG